MVKGREFDLVPCLIATTQGLRDDVVNLPFDLARVLLPIVDEGDIGF